MKNIILVLSLLMGLYSSSNASRYGDCENYCKSMDLPGKSYQSNTMAGACSKGCNFRHWQSNSEGTNDERARQQCIDKYGSWGSKFEYCVEAVEEY